MYHASLWVLWFVLLMLGLVYVIRQRLKTFQKFSGPYSIRLRVLEMT